jgi:hypothetical protein
VATRAPHECSRAIGQLTAAVDEARAQITAVMRAE